jgi:hypothetical protein
MAQETHVNGSDVLKAIAIVAAASLVLASCPDALAYDFDAVYSDSFETFPCVGLACAQVSCPAGQTTSVDGTVYAPNGTLPLPNVVVYVPNGPLQPLLPGASCDRCDTPPSGKPLVSTTSSFDGSFKLDNMPVANNVTLVLLSGKWRRILTIPSVAACVDTPIGASVTRLPKNQSEGDMPRIAVSTGGGEALECLLRQAGIDDTEFTTNTGAGRVNLYAGTSGTDKFDAQHQGGAAFPPSTALWASSDSLRPYDQVLLACENAQNTATKPAPSLIGMKAYADLGGRIYASHWHNYWIQAGPSPWPAIATWNLALPNLESITANVNNTFPMGDEFSKWLFVVGASSQMGKLDLLNARNTATAIDNSVATRWLYLDTTANNQPSIQRFTFTTPVESQPAQQCGRVAFSDHHMTSESTSSDTLEFPSGGCSASPLSAQNKSILYAIFDLERCVGSDRR